MNLTGMRFLAIAVTAVVFSGCGTPPEPEKEDLGITYLHTPEFLAGQIREELRERWRIASEDPAGPTFVTEWDVNLHQMNTFGRRHRLTVSIEEAEEPGRYRVGAAQETEQNTNEENPAAVSVAEWEPAPHDGALAQRFLFNLSRRLNPAQGWKEELTR